MVVAQSTLVSTHLFGDPLGGAIKRWLGFGGQSAGVNNDSAADMDRNLGPGQMRLFREHHMSFDRGLKIFSQDRAETRLDMLAQHCAGVDLLARDGQLHGCIYLSRRSRDEIGVLGTEGGNPPAGGQAVPGRHPLIFALRRAPLCHLVLQSASSLSRRRRTEEGMRIASRYLATVRRAMSTPSRASSSTMRSSESVLSGSSASIIARIRWRTAFAECALLPPEAAIAEVKKYLSS